MVEVLIKETLYDCSGDCKEEGGGLKWGFSWARQGFAPKYPARSSFHDSHHNHLS
jgi:hypothetical protein